MFYGMIRFAMFKYFRSIQLQLVSQRYGWIREGVTAGRLFVASGVVPDFKLHEHVGCSCKPDSVWWVVNSFDVFVARHSGLSEK